MGWTKNHWKVVISSLIAIVLIVLGYLRWATGSETSKNHNVKI